MILVGIKEDILAALSADGWTAEQLDNVKVSDQAVVDLAAPQVRLVSDLGARHVTQDRGHRWLQLGDPWFAIKS